MIHTGTDTPQIHRERVRIVSARCASNASSRDEISDAPANEHKYTYRVGSDGVLVLEDDGFIRKGVVRQIEAETGFRVVAEAADVESARKAIESTDATIGVFDLQLADGSSIPLIQIAAERGISVLVLTVWDDDENVYQALAAGAAGYLLKGDASTKIGEALTTLKDGGAPISPTIARRLLDDFRNRPGMTTDKGPLKVETQLTAREKEIIELFAKGATYDEVAKMLSMSVNTVRHHVRAMYRKLHVCSKAEAVTMAFRLA